MQDTNIFWIRNDLRFEDNTALNNAVEISYKEKCKLLLVFHINTDQVNEGTYSNDYFFSALNVFYTSVKNLDSDILFLYGDPETAFKNFFAVHNNIKRMFFNASERGYGLKRDKKVIELCKGNNIDTLSFSDKHLHSALQILNGSNEPYKVYTPYYNKWCLLKKDRVINFEKNKYRKVMTKDFENPQKCEFDKILAKITNDRKNNFESLCGEQLALKNLKCFIEKNLADYDTNRDNIVLDRNSSMSHYLSTGQISIRQIYHRLEREEHSSGKEVFMKQLAWRDFYNMVYFVNPNQDKQEIIKKYRNIEWNRNKYAFNIWKLGMTGFPLIDAAMRDLNKTGRMHNRLRMIVASFLVKDLLIDWKMGEAYFKDMLCDYDSASNIGSWQWIASTGTDACPYFRIFNPTTQSKKHDKNGDYIRKHLPELKNVDSKYIHEPYKYKDKISDFNYFDPIVVHKEQREKVLNMYASGLCTEKNENMKEEFTKRYTLFELQKLKEKDKKEIQAFHAKNKYLYFCYDVNIKDKMGSLLAQEKKYTEIFNEYKNMLKELFIKTPTKRSNINSFEHIYGYFKKFVTVEEKKIFFTLLKKYATTESQCKLESNKADTELKKFLLNLAEKYDVEYIKKQSLLSDL